MSLYFPMFVDLSEKNILFIGADDAVTKRVREIADFAGSVTVVSQEAGQEIIDLYKEGRIEYCHRRFSETDLEGADIVFISTGHSGTDIRIAGMCRRSRKMVHVASDPSLCDFHFPGLARRDPIVVGVSSSGEDPEMQEQAAAYFRRLIEKK